MTPRQTAKLWNCKTQQVISYCIEGMVQADYYSVTNEWDIPQGTERPIFTRYNAVGLLKRIKTEKKGLIELETYSRNTMNEALCYFDKMGFIKGYNPKNDLQKNILLISVSEAGNKLMQDEAQCQDIKKKHMISKFDASLEVFNIKLNIKMDY